VKQEMLEGSGVGIISDATRTTELLLSSSIKQTAAKRSRFVCLKKIAFVTAFLSENCKHSLTAGRSYFSCWLATGFYYLFI